MAWTEPRWSLAKREKATMSEIAAAAGVSVPTVSKVVNGRPDVAPRTRQAIEKLLARAWLCRQAVGTTQAGRPHRPGLRRPRQSVGDGDPGRRRGGRLPGRDRGRGVRRTRPAPDPTRRPLAGEPGRPALRRRAADPLRTVHWPAAPADRPGRTGRHRRSRRGSAAGHPVGRRHQLGRWTQRGRAPGIAGTRADRGHRRTDRRAVQPGAGGRIPGRDGRRRARRDDASHLAGRPFDGCRPARRGRRR